MQFSVFLFTLIVVVPSLLFSAFFNVNNIPLKINVNKPNLPIQLFLLGLVLPLIPFLLACAVVTTQHEIGILSLFLHIGGMAPALDPSKITDIALRWIPFLALFYTFCLMTAMICSIVIGKFPGALKYLEAIGVTDEERMAK